MNKGPKGDMTMQWKDLLRETEAAKVVKLEVVSPRPEWQNHAEERYAAEEAALAKVKALDPETEPQAFDQALLAFVSFYPGDKGTELGKLLIEQAFKRKALVEELEQTRPARALARVGREAMLALDVEPDTAN